MSIKWPICLFAYGIPLKLSTNKSKKLNQNETFYIYSASILNVMYLTKNNQEG